MTSIGRRIVSSTVWAAAETWVRHLLVFAIFIVLARLLGPEAIGLATLALLAPVVLAVPVQQGIPDAIIQRMEIEPIHLDSAFWLLVTAGAFLSILIWLSSPLIAVAFGEPLLAELIRWTSVIIVIKAFQAVPGAILKRHLEFRLFALRTMIGLVIGGTVGIAMAISGFGVWSIIAMQLAGSAAEAIVMFIGGMWLPRFRYSHAHCRQLFGFAVPIIGNSIMAVVNDAIPKVVLGAFIGPAAVGIYAVARRPLDLLASALITPLNTVVMPAVARLQNDPIKIDRFLNAAIRFAGLVGFPAFMGLAAIAPVAVPLVFGEQWREAVPATQIIMLLGLIRTIDGPCAHTFLALGNSGLLLKFHLVYTVLGAILLTVAAQINVEATMVAILIANLLLLPIFLYFAHRISNIDVLKPLAALPQLAAAAALMVVAVGGYLHVVPDDTPRAIVLASGIAIGVLVYGAAALVLLRPELDNARATLLRLRG